MPVRLQSAVAALRVPHAGRTFAAALAGRLCYGVTPLSLMLAITGDGRSYAVAGTAEALFAAGATVLAPFRARLIDRYGRRRALLPMALIFAALLALLSVLTWWRGVPYPFIIVAAGAAGSCAPPLGPTMRALWNDLIPDSPDLLRRAFTLDSVAEEILFLTGPLIAGLVATAVAPSAGLLVSAALVAGGTIVLVTSPAVRPMTNASEKAGSAGRLGRGLVQPVLGALGVGICLGSVGLLMVAFARLHHDAAAAAWCSAAMSGGSALGGVAYAAARWKPAPRRQLPFLVAVPAIVLALAGLSPNMVVMVVAAFAMGICISPGLSVAYLVGNHAVPPESRVRAGTWVNTAVNAGNTLGAATIGYAIVSLPLHFSYIVAAVPAVILAATAFCLTGSSATVAAPTKDPVPSVSPGC